MNKKDIINEYLNERIDMCEHALAYARAVDADPEEASSDFVEEIRFEAFRRLEILKILRNELNETEKQK